MWTDTSTFSYNTVTWHFIVSNWQMCSQILATRLMEERSTAAIMTNKQWKNYG